MATRKTATGSTSRRQFLLAGLGAAAVPLLTRLTWARALEGAREGSVLLVVELGGGNDGLNTVVPFEDPEYVRARPTLRIEKSGVLPLGAGLGLRRELAALKGRFDRGQLAIVEGVGYPGPDRSHFRSTDIWHSASLEPERARSGWIGRLCECAPAGGSVTGGGGMPALMIGTSKVPLALVGEHSTALQVGDVARFRVPVGPQDGGTAGRRATLQRLSDAEAGSKGDGGDTLAWLRDAARASLANAAKVEEVTKRSRSNVAYPDTALARELGLAAQLIAGGFECAAYFVRQEGYDTHAFQADTHALLLTELDGALGAFLADVEAAKALDRVVVLVYSEFGRRVKENGSKGTDHGAAAPLFVAGGGVRGGLVGKPPSLARADLDGGEDGDLVHAIDFRRVYATLLEDGFGVASKRVLGADFEKLPLFA
jgi:uncharacterized protein (DUF1501 family)